MRKIKTKIHYHNYIVLKNIKVPPLIFVMSFWIQLINKQRHHTCFIKWYALHMQSLIDHRDKYIIIRNSLSNPNKNTTCLTIIENGKTKMSSQKSCTLTPQDISKEKVVVCTVRMQYMAYPP